jgi:3-hydroxyacyl-CoA dehydrogenase/enoyl-CoA hydratase/3-hydroxybutyryl-CoA epimerase
MSNIATIEKRSDGIAIVWLDQPNEKVNKVSLDFIKEVDNTFSALEHDNEVKAVVILSKKKDWIAGADIDMFANVKQKGDFAPITRNGHQSLARLEKSKKPVIAAIHGGCLGAGTEIALACHARILSDDKSTHFSLPEVMLGTIAWWWRHTAFASVDWFTKVVRHVVDGQKNLCAQSTKHGFSRQNNN